MMPPFVVPPPGQAGGGAAGNPRSLLILLVKGFLTLGHHFAFSVGCLFFIQALQIGNDIPLLGRVDDTGGLHGLFQALRLFVSNLLMPFSETVALALSPAEDLELKVLAFWMPMLLGTWICSGALLGHLSLRYRRAAFLLPYLCIATLVLVWELEFIKIIRQMTNVEELASLQALDKSSKLHDMQYTMYQAPYESFSALFSEFKCIAEVPGDVRGRVKAKCSEGSFDGKMLEFVAFEFCRARYAHTPEEVAGFQRRVEACQKQGRDAKILPSESLPRDIVFCRCRASLYDFFRLLSSCSWMLWCGDMLTGWAVLYFAVEQNIAKMEPRQRTEVMCFGVVGLIVLALRAAVLPHWFEN